MEAQHTPSCRSLFHAAETFLLPTRATLTVLQWLIPGGPARGEGKCRDRHAWSAQEDRQTDRQTDRREKREERKRPRSARSADPPWVAAFAASLRLSAGFLPGTIECLSPAATRDFSSHDRRRAAETASTLCDPSCRRPISRGPRGGPPSIWERVRLSPLHSNLAACVLPFLLFLEQSYDTRADQHWGLSLDWGRPRDCRAGGRRNRRGQETQQETQGVRLARLARRPQGH